MLLKEVYRTQLMLIHYVHVVEIIPEFLIDSRGFHHIPSVGIAYRLIDSVCGSSSLLELLTYIGGIEDGSTSLDTDSMLDLLRFNTTTVAQIREVPLGVLARDMTHRECQTTHELIYVIQA